MLLRLLKASCQRRRLAVHGQTETLSPAINCISQRHRPVLSPSALWLLATSSRLAVRLRLGWTWVPNCLTRPVPTHTVNDPQPKQANRRCFSSGTDPTHGWTRSKRLRKKAEPVFGRWGMAKLVRSRTGPLCSLTSQCVWRLVNGALPDAALSAAEAAATV